MATLHPEPPFALCGPRGTLIARGVRTRYCDVRAAQAALRSGTAPILLGALPFDVSRPAALMVPDGVLRARKLPDWPTGPLPKVRVAAALPPPADYLTRIGRARDLLAAFDGPLHKVVLARAVQLTADAPLDARVLLRRLVVADPTAYGYLVDLTSAGNDDTGAALVGASPELLVARSGNRVMCKPFAGSAPRAADPKLDAANAAAFSQFGQEPTRTPIGRRHDAGSPRATMRGPDNPSPAPVEPHPSRLASVHRDHRPAAQHLDDGNRSGFGATSHPGGWWGPDKSCHRAHRRTRGRPWLLRRRGWLVRRPGRRPLGGVYPVRATFG
ncbi:isochorismate synthase [Mycobacterium tuberculosis]|nr:isochorismate synthase [Mycobacterium tuberculosis]